MSKKPIRFSKETVFRAYLEGLSEASHLQHLSAKELRSYAREEFDRWLWNETRRQTALIKPQTTAAK